MRLHEFFLREIEVDDRSDDPRYFTHDGRNYYVEELDWYWSLTDMGTKRELEQEEVRVIPGLEAAYSKAVNAAEAAGLGSQEEPSDTVKSFTSDIIGIAKKSGY